MQQDLEALKIRVCTAQPKQLICGLWNVQVSVGKPSRTVRLTGFTSKEEALVARDNYIDDLNLKTKEIHDAIATS